MNVKKDKITAAELRKLKKLIATVPKEKQVVANNLISELAFMKTTLENLKSNIREKGEVELFQNGAQVMNRENPALKSYNVLIKNYSNLYKQLLDILPDYQEGDPLLDFIGGEVD